MPSTATAAAMNGAKRAKRVGGRVEPSWRAATGGTRVARHAGTTAESIVMLTPTIRPTTTVRGCITRPLSGMSTLSAFISAPTPAANPRPAARPTTDASTPMTKASTEMLSMTCRREAPRARSMANSRRRWATVIEKALKMMKAPTSTATPPSESSTGLRNEPMASLIWALWSAAACSPVFTSASFGSTARMRPASASGDTPSSPWTSISDTLPTMSNHDWPSASVMLSSSEPPSDDSLAKVNTPVTLTS